MSSFTFFGRPGVNALLGWERDQNQEWYKMALADEQRSVARITATRELYRPLTHLDTDSQARFKMFFGQMQQLCKSKKCFRGKYDLDIDLYESPSTVAFDQTITRRVNEDFRQLRHNKFNTANGDPALSRFPDLFKSDPEDTPRRFAPAGQEADVDLFSSTIPEERLLSQRASSQKKRDEQRETIDRQRKRSKKMKSYEWAAKAKMTEAFASVLSSAVPDAEGIIGAYVSELIDDAAEWVVRPIVDRLWKNGYRPDDIQDLGPALTAIPTDVEDSFSNFHARGTRASEVSQFDSPASVTTFFNDEEQSDIKMKADMRKTYKEFEEREREEREAEP
jgi:hypothetical protein